MPTDVSFSFHRASPSAAARTDHHADGWGIAFFEGAGLRALRRPPAGLRLAGGRAHRAAIRSQLANVIAHIRKATQGPVALENCHPFVRELWGRYWVFAHNGNLEDFQPRLHGDASGRSAPPTANAPSAG